jgi:hypothetical protein
MQLPLQRLDFGSARVRESGSESELACTRIRGEMGGAARIEQARAKSIVVRSSRYRALITRTCTGPHAALRAVSVRKCSMVRTAHSVCALALRTRLIICLDYGVPGGGEVFSASLPWQGHCYR